jgi:hypothetical protein
MGPQKFNLIKNLINNLIKYHYKDFPNIDSYAD